VGRQTEQQLSEASGGALNIATFERESPKHSLDILLAEDNQINQLVAKNLLEREGHLITLALDGRKAYEMAQNHCFDLILMDVQMPEMDGFQATAAIREWEQLHNRRTPILAMTANALKGDRELCLSAGMDGYVTKPVNMQDLRSQIETVLASA
jgi:CheY-like chemotaxis protein